MKLPTTIQIPVEHLPDDMYEELCDFVSDYISERTGFLHNGFQIDVKITASNIMYDTDED